MIWIYNLKANDLWHILAVNRKINVDYHKIVFIFKSI